jgi:AcrR family transcriptional regulator
MRYHFRTVTPTRASLVQTSGISDHHNGHPHKTATRMSLEKRQVLLEGMLDVVGSEGYATTSVRTLLDRTGLYRQVFYDLFEDKEDCYLQAYDAGVERIERRVGAAAAEEDSWRGQLRRGLGAGLDFLDAEPDAGRALIVEVHPAGARALQKRDRQLARLAGYLGRGRDASGADPSAPPIAPEAIAAGIHSVVHTRLAAGAAGGFRALLPEFMYIAILPYFGVEAAAEELRLAET